jgi:hypothetical protein
MHTIQFRPVGMSLGKWASYRLTPAIYVVPQPPREKTKNERIGSDSKDVDLCVVLNEAVVKTTTIMRVPTFYQYPSARMPSHMYWPFRELAFLVNKPNTRCRRSWWLICPPRKQGAAVLVAIKKKIIISLGQETGGHLEEGA